MSYPSGCDSKIAFWPHTSNLNIASYRLRCLEVVKGLKELGHNVDIFNGEVPNQLILSKRYDEKTLSHALDLKKKYGTKIFLDICDNHFFFQNATTVATKRALLLRNAAESVDCVIVCSQYLKGVLEQEVPSAKHVVVIDDIIESPYLASRLDHLIHPIQYFRYRKFKSFIAGKSDVKHLVWYGNYGGEFAEGGMSSLSAIYPALLSAYSKNPFVLSVISNSRSHFVELTKAWAIPTYYLPWSNTYFSELLKLQDIALLPIQKNPFTLAKTSNRVCTALCHGLDVIADDIPSYLEFKKDICIGNWSDSLDLFLSKPSKSHKQKNVNFNLRNAKTINAWHKLLTNS